jgi:colicin import membrane protein
MNDEKIVGTSLTTVSEYATTAVVIADLRSRHAGVVYDVAESKQMKLAKEARAEIRGYRTGLEKTRKEIKAPALEHCRLIDSEAQRLTAELVALEEPIDVQIKAEESRAEVERLEKIEAEIFRVEAIQQRIDGIRNVPASLVGKPSVIITGQLAKLEAEVLDEDEFAEHYQAARDALELSISRVKQMHTDQLAHEAEQKQIAADRSELERMRLENVRLSREAADAETSRRAEADRLAQVERERVAAEERAQREAEQAEQARLAAIERGKAMEAAAAERDRLAAERAEQDAALKAERERQAAVKVQLDADAAKLKRERADAAKKAEAVRLAGLGLHEAVRAVLTHFEPNMDDDSEPQCIKDLRVAFLNDPGIRGVPSMAKKVAA